jgi:cytochrome c peroxidase
MNPLLLVGTGAVVVGLTAAGLIVWFDLAPVARIPPWRRLALLAGLAGGVLAFGLKLAVVETLTAGGLELLTPPPPAVVVASEPPEPGAPAWGHAQWSALPEAAPAPSDNPTTPEKAALGARLFRDPLLSVDGTVSCATCHDLNLGGAERRPTSRGVGGQIGKRNAPTVYNAAFQARLFWDGRARSLEEQALGPMGNPIEMGNADLSAVAARVAADASYRDAFAAAFGAQAPIDVTRVSMAIAAFERTLVTPDSAYDRFVRGDAEALTAQQIRGMALFEEVGCATCHSGPNFSSASLLSPDRGAGAMRLFPAHPSVYDARYDLVADGGAAPTSGRAGVWRVPSLRNVALTAPYFHNGSVDDLTETVRIMATVQCGRVVTDDLRVEPIVAWSNDRRRLLSYTPSTLSNGGVADIVAFLNALTSDRLARGP